jgi:glycogen synthase
MHIGFVTAEYVLPGSPDGGLAAYIQKTAALLAGRGHKVTIFFLSSRTGQWHDGNVEIHEIKRVATPYLIRRLIDRTPYLRSLRKLCIQMLSTYHLARYVRKFHRKHPLDIVQIPNRGLPGYYLRKNKLFPVVCRASSYTTLYYEINGFTQDFHHKWFQRMELQQLRDVGGRFSPSKAVSDIYKREANLQVDVLRTPVNLLPESAWDYTFYNEYLRNQRYLLFVGRLEKVKGADLIGQIGRQLLDRYPDLYLVMVGSDGLADKNTSMLDYIRQCIGTDEPRFTYSPSISKAQLYPLYANAVGVLMPSRIDNYPNVCLEAQSVGTPVVGTYQSSLEEMIEDGVSGFLAENSNPASFLTAIERLLSQNIAQRTAMIDCINALTQQRLDADPIAQLEQYYTEIIERFH